MFNKWYAVPSGLVDNDSYDAPVCLLAVSPLRHDQTCTSLPLRDRQPFFCLTSVAHKRLNVHMVRRAFPADLTLYIGKRWHGPLHHFEHK